ncbi:MAG: hypothetical protein R3C60_14500 [Parvularculaceae bacterium]
MQSSVQWKRRLAALQAGLLAVLLVLFVPAAAFAEGDAAPAPQAKRIGVVSILGDLLYDDHIGFTAFGNKLEKHDVSEWGLDDVWEGKIGAALADLSGAEIVPLSADRAALRVAYPTADDEKSIIAQYRYPKLKRITETLRQLAADNQLDEIVMLASDAYELAGSNQSIESFGLVTFGGSGPGFYYMVADLYLIDGATGEAKTSKSLQDAHSDREHFGKLPSMKIPDELKKTRFSAYTDEQKAALGEEFKTMADEAIPLTLSKLTAPKKSAR